MGPSERLALAIAHGGVTEPDGRGLMRLAEARAMLRGVGAFVKGEGRSIPGVGHVLASDQLWAALLSLEDGAEFVELATSIDWQFHPRGFANIDLYLRYGNAIVPWLATRVDAERFLVNTPWCVLPCLLACDSDAGFELAWNVRGVRGAKVDVPVAWRRRHPEVAARLLARRAESDPWARAHLRAFVPTPPGPPRVDDILAWLDACAARLIDTQLVLWPSDDIARAVAVRDGDDWGLVLERVHGTRPSGVFAARVVVAAFGSRVRGPVAGAVAGVRELAAGDPLGPLTESLPLVGLTAPRIVAVVPHVSRCDRPGESDVFRALATAIAH